MPLAVQLHCYNKALSVHRKVAGEFLHDVNAIDAIKIAGSSIVARVRYHTEDTLMYIAYHHVSKYSFSVSEPQP